MNLRISKLCFLLVTVFTFVLSAPVISLHAQQIGSGSDSDQSDSQSQAPSFQGFSELQLPSEFSGFFYIDQLGVDLMATGFTYEGTLNQDQYQLGPNDVLTIDIKGNMSMLLRGLVVNSQGDLILPTVGEVSVSGLTVTEARKKLEEHIGEKYKKVNISISLDKPRIFQVHVAGNIPNPGRYSVPAQTRVDQIVMKSIRETVDRIRRSQNRQETPLDLRSNTRYITNQFVQEKKNEKTTQSLLENKPYAFRNIEIVHRDGTRDTADLVSYFSHNNLQSNPYIQDGDRINLHTMKKWTPRISISGAVQSQEELEFREKDSPHSLLKIAGGYAADADTTKMFIFRKNDTDGIKKLVVQPDNFDSFELRPNDRVIVPVDQSKRTSSSAWVYGQAEHPGNYPIVDGETTVYKLITMAGGLSDGALPEGAYLLRNSSDKKRVPEPIDDDYKLNKSLLKRTSNQSIQGFEYLDLETKVSEGKVYVNMGNTSELKDIKLFDGDQLYIPRNRNTVFVFGQVNQPGFYMHKEGKAGVNEYINDAGGFALAASEESIYVIKAGTRSWYKPGNTSIQSGDMIFVDRIPYQNITDERNRRSNNIRLILAGISTITGIITTVVAITQ